jgi:hypothetical protein
MIGMETTLSVLNECDPAQYPFPIGFGSNGWIANLPFSAAVILHSISSGAALGKDMDTIIDEIELWVERQGSADSMFFDFSAKPPKGKRKRLEFEDDLQRESRIRETLERSGYHYPQSVCQMASLLVNLGLVFEVERDGVMYLDVLLSPYPHVNEVLKIMEA